MVEVVWEFVVKEEARGTTVLRDTMIPRRYLTIDLWETEAQLEQALAENRAEYADLQAAMGEWTESRTELGVFRVLAEATVRPRGRGRGSKSGGGRRRGGRGND